MATAGLPVPVPTDFTSYDPGTASCLVAHSTLIYKGHREIATTLTTAGYGRVVIFRDGATNAYLARFGSTPEEGGRRWVLSWRVHGGFLSDMQAVRGF